MKLIRENFDGLFFTEARFSNPSFSGGVLSVSVKGVFPMAGYPLVCEEVKAMDGVLVFRGVSKSTRTMTEYIGDPFKPDGFKEDYMIEDVLPTTPQSNTGRLYLFEGFLESPCSWVNWIIRAESFEFLIE